MILSQNICTRTSILAYCHFCVFCVVEFYCHRMTLT